MKGNQWVTQALEKFIFIHANFWIHGSCFSSLPHLSDWSGPHTVLALQLTSSIRHTKEHIVGGFVCFFSDSIFDILYIYSTLKLVLFYNYPKYRLKDLKHTKPPLEPFNTVFCLLLIKQLRKHLVADHVNSQFCWGKVILVSLCFNLTEVTVKHIADSLLQPQHHHVHLLHFRVDISCKVKWVHCV